MSNSFPNNEKDTYKEKKFENKLDKIHTIQRSIKAFESIGFRGIVLIYVFLVEVGLFLTVFLGKPIDGVIVTAITIIAVLPILVIRAFDIKALNLTKEGITSEMVDSEEAQTGALITDILTNGKELPIKFKGVETGTIVNVKTDKLIVIEYNGIPYTLAIVEEIK
jgi:hypothetical protein